MKILFWLLLAADLVGLLGLFVLGLAAATSTRDSPLEVAAYMLIVPGLLLGLAVLLYRRGTPLARGTATLMVALPAIVLVGSGTVQSAKLKSTSDSSGTLRYFREGPAREILDAIDRNDASTVAILAGQVDLNARGTSNMTLLVYALRRLEQAPHAIEPIRALLTAGADPNRAADELPLEVAIQQSHDAGPEPVAMLLASGADPNTINQFGTPVFFLAAGITVPLGVLDTLLNHGADLKVRDRQGLTIVFLAANTSNWRAVLHLLERGTDYRQGLTINGETFTQMMESRARVFGDTAGVAEVLEYLEHHQED
jgi:hypothetical protein